jgi:hypothetical protein
MFCVKFGVNMVVILSLETRNRNPLTEFVRRILLHRMLTYTISKYK